MHNQLLRFRTLMNIMDRSIEDARNRRLGVSCAPVPVTHVVNGKLKASRVDRRVHDEQERRTG